jgi:hypothetical protein
MWQLVAPIAAPDAPPREVELGFGAISGRVDRFVTHLVVGYRGKVPYLYFFVGDPDLGETFEFQRAA